MALGSVTITDYYICVWYFVHSDSLHHSLTIHVHVISSYVNGHTGDHDHPCIVSLSLYHPYIVC